MRNIVLGLLLLGQALSVSAAGNQERPVPIPNPLWEQIPVGRFRGPGCDVHISMGAFRDFVQVQVRQMTDGPGIMGEGLFGDMVSFSGHLSRRYRESATREVSGDTVTYSFIRVTPRRTSGLYNTPPITKTLRIVLSRQSPAQLVSASLNVVQGHNRIHNDTYACTIGGDE